MGIYKMKNKKSAIALVSSAVGLALSVPAVASEYSVRVSLKDKRVSTFEAKDVVYTDWSDKGGHYDCQSWSPSVDMVDFGSDFIQTRMCKQAQERIATPRDYDQFSDSYKERPDKQYTETRVVSELESQSAIGTRRDWNSFSSTFTEWTDYGSAIKHGAWMPAAATQTSSFEQTRDYKQPQEQFEQMREKDSVTQDIRNVGAPIRHTQEDARMENRQVDVTSGSWYNTTTENFGEWLPSPTNETSDFEQTQSYTQNQSRNWTYQANGVQIHSRVEDRQLTSEENTRNVNVSASAWSDTDRDSHTSWSPVASTQTSGFTQSRNYTQKQERTWTYQAGGSVLKTRIEGQDIANRTESRSVSVAWNDWANKGAHYDCDAWSPETNTVGYNVAFTQTRDCSQNQERTRSYQAEGGVDLGSHTESKVITETESQGATGVGSWTSHESTFTSWVDSGSAYDHGAYSPSPSVQTANFTQTRGYKHNQVRNEQKRERDTISGAIRNVGSPIQRTQVVNRTEDRTVTVTAGSWSNGSKSNYTSWSPAPTSQTSAFSQSRTYSQAQSRVWNYTSGATSLHTRNEDRTLSSQSESRSVTVEWSGWVDSGNHYDCGTWSPATNTVGYNVAFTQTRSCKQNQTRNRIYKSGGSTVHTAQESRTIDESESQGATGVGSWTSHTSTFTSWTNEGSAYDHGTYSPAASTQTANFTQSRSYKQNQYRMEQMRERDTISGAIRNVGSPIKRTQTVTPSQSRSITVSAAGWSNGSKSNYTSWSPSPTSQTSTFSQSRTYSQAQSRVWSYLSGSTSIHSRTENRTLSSQSESRSITVTWSSWVDSGSHYSCGTWSPATNTVGYNVSFTQTRTCKQNQVRNRIYKSGGSTVHTVQESRAINENESQAAKGIGSWTSHSSTFTSWTNEGGAYSYSSYSPAASTQTSSFTQTRQYSQNQYRYEQQRERDTISGAVRNKGAAIKRTQTVRPSQSRSVTVSVGGWSNGSTSNYTSWSPTPSTQTSTFTQSRTYSQAQSRTWSYRVGSTSIHSRAENRTLSSQSQSRSIGVSWSSWVDSGGHYSCGSYSPSTGTVNYGQSFTQTRSCKQNQTRNRIYKSGSTTISTKSESRTINENSTRSATGTKNYVTGSSTGAWSSWSNSGGVYSCSSYSPDTSTVNSGQTFTQTRSCKQNQTRSRTIYNVWANGSTSVKSTETASQTINVTQSRSATGTKKVVVREYWTAWSSWQYLGYHSQMSCDFYERDRRKFAEYSDGSKVHIRTGWEEKCGSRYFDSGEY